jgi:hypothetical protein
MTEVCRLLTELGSVIFINAPPSWKLGLWAVVARPDPHIWQISVLS